MIDAFPLAIYSYCAIDSMVQQHNQDLYKFTKILSVWFAVLIAAKSVR